MKDMIDDRLLDEMRKKDEKPDIDQIVSQRELWKALDLVEEGNLTGEDRDRLVAMVLVHYWQYPVSCTHLTLPTKRIV